jgi:ABC-2 type transport system permease protein
MLNAIGVLVRTRFLIARNTFWRGKIGRKALLILAALALSAAAYGLYRLTLVIVAGLTSQRFADFLARAARSASGLPPGFSLEVRDYLLALPSAVLFFTLVVLVLTSFTTVLSSLYLSGDMDLLLAAPVPMRAVFVVKFFGGLLAPYLLLFFLLGPFLLGFGQGLGWGAAFFIVALAVLLLLPLLPTGLGALLVMAVVRVIPARRAREIVGVIGGMVGISWYIFSQFSNQLAPRVANARMLDYLRRFDSSLLPSAWAGRALVSAGSGDWPALALYGGLFAALSIGSFVLCVALAERLYYAGWSNMSTQGGRVRKRRTANDEGQTTRSAAAQPAAFRLLSLVLPRQSAAVLYKDLRVFPRDLRNVQQLIFPLVLAGIWTFRLLTDGSPFDTGRQPDFFRSLSTLASAGISFYICLVLSSAMGGPSISREGRGFWLLKTAPISAGQILLGKLALAYLPFPTIGALFVVFLSILQQSTPADFARSLALVLLGGLGATSITLGLGAAFPKLSWDNPRQQTSFQAGCLSPLLYMAYLGLALGAVLGLPLLGNLAPEFATALALLGWAIFLALTAAVVWGALSFGAARLERLEIA